MTDVIKTENAGIKYWLYSLAIACFGTVLLYNPESIAITKFWFITFFAIALFAFEPIPNIITSVMMMLTLIVTGVASPDVVFTGWSTFIPWVCFSGLFIAQLISKTGFAQRIALIIISSVARTPLLLFISFLVAGYALNFIIADGFTNTIVLSAFGISICQALGLDPFSKASSSIMLACYFGGMTVGTNFLPNGIGLAGISILAESGYNITWLEFLLDNLTLSFFISLASYLILYFYSRKEIQKYLTATREVLTEELKKMGTITRDEIKSIVLLLVAVGSLVAEPWHGMPGVFMMALILLFAFIPPISLLDKDDALSVNTGIIFFIPGCLAIGFTAASLGLPQWITGQVLPILEQITSEAGASVFAYISGVVANFILTPLAASAALTEPMANLATQAGFNIKSLIYPFFIGLDQWLFPYELAPAIYIYALGYLKIQHIIKIMLIRIAVCSIIVWLNTTFIWSVFGL